jgi:flagellar motor switch/type III secretory pathway protein FliN
MSSSMNSLFSSDALAPVAFDTAAWLLDVPCPVEFILGSTTIKVGECAAFTRDTVIRLRQAAGSDLEVRAAGVGIATGEVVIVDDTVGLRIGRILPPAGQDLA